MEGLVDELIEGAREEMAVVAEHGGAVEAVPYMKARLVESHRERISRIESGEQKVIGQNSYTETEDSPLTVGEDGGILTPDPEVERERIEALEEWRARARRRTPSRAALEALAEAARDESANLMPPTIEAAKAGATTGEWAETLREVFGAYRGPTGVDGSATGGDAELLADARAKVDAARERLGHRIRILVAKPGLDGHSNGAEQIAVRAKDVGMEVIYQGIRLTPEEIAASAVQEDVDVVGLSILSGSHRELVPRVVELIREGGVEAPVIVGGIIPPADAKRLADAGVARVYTPKDFDLNRIMVDIAELVAEPAPRSRSPHERQPASARLDCDQLQHRAGLAGDDHRAAERPDALDGGSAGAAARHPRRRLLSVARGRRGQVRRDDRLRVDGERPASPPAAGVHAGRLDPLHNLRPLRRPLDLGVVAEGGQAGQAGAPAHLVGRSDGPDDLPGTPALQLTLACPTLHNCRREMHRR